MSEARNRTGIREEEVLGVVYEPALIRRLLSYVKPYGARVAVAVFLLLLIAGLEQIGPYLTKLAIDDHILKKDFPGLLRIVLLFIGLYLFLTVAKVIQALITGWIGEKVMYDLRRQLFAHVQKQSLAFFDRNPVGRLVTRLTSDVQTLSEIFSSGIVVIFGDLLTLVGIITAMLLLNWRLALVAFVVIPPLLVVTFFFRSRLREAFRQVRLQVAAINSFLQEHLSGIRIVQLFNHQAATSRNFSRVNSDLRGAHLRTVALFSLFFPLLELISALSIALILLRGGYLILDDTLTLGGLVAFFQYGERFFRPIRDLAEKWNIFQAGMASTERVFAVLDTEPSIMDPSSPAACEQVRGEVEFDHVHFAYNTGEEVLRDITFRVEPGETVALVGATGAGKSTITHLVNRSYDVTRGSVKIDGVDVRNWCRNELLRHIAYVPQEVFLFHGTIRDNIALGDEFTEEEIRRAAETVNAHRFIERLPGGYDEPVMERGSTLSSGQRQLLSFARALIRNPRILILDEATSAIDPETERLIQEAMERLMKGRTSILVAHRLSTVRRADRILVLHKGELREQGSHDELLAGRGIYWRLYRLQYVRAA
ncbi:MAG TPA: ABC transporter ATP-binding protein [Bacteroidetes bacterium]|nr:ABC transporter ATP-binding protein [Bacteroidota bacterium]